MTGFKKILKENSFLIIFGIILILFHVFYQIANRLYPRDDSSDLFYTAQLIWFKFKNEGILSFIENLYTIRSWKAIIYSSVVAVSLLLVDGDTLLAVRLTHIVILIFLFLNLYRLFKHFKIPKFSSLLSSGCLTVLPFVLTTSETYTAEFLYMCCAVGFFANYLKREQGNSFYIQSLFWLAFGILTRPAEMLMISFVVVVLELYRAIRNGYRLMIVLTVCTAFFVLLSLSYRFARNRLNSGWPLNLEYWFFGIALLFFAISIFRYRFKKNYFFDLASSSMLVSLLWYFPSGQELTGWIYESSVGYVAQKTGGRFGNSSVEFLTRIFVILGSYPLLTLTVVLLSMFLLLRGYKKIGGDFIGKDWAVIALSILTPFILGCFGSNADLRYYCSPMLFIFSLVLILLYRVTAEKQAIYLLIVGLAIIASTWNPILGLFNYKSSSEFIKNWQSGNLSMRIIGREDAVLKFYDELVVAIGEPQEKILKVQSLDLACPMATNKLLDPMTLTIRSRELGWKWDFDRFVIWDLFEINDQVKRLLSKSDYVLIGPDGASCRAETHGGNPISVLSEHLVNKAKDGTVLDLGFESSKKIKVYGNLGEEADVYLLKVKK